MNPISHFHPHPAHHPAPHPVPEDHIPPHLRRSRLRCTFREEDLGVFRDIFGSDITAISAMKDITNAPGEITVLGVMALQLAASLRAQLQQHCLPTETRPMETADDPDQQDSVTLVKWDCPALGKSARQLLCALYGDDQGSAYYHELNSGPNEVATVARIFAYVQEKVGDLYEHS